MDKVDSDDNKKDLGNSRAVGRMIRVSPIKLNYEAKAIRGKNVDDALSYLQFSKRRISLQVKKILESAIANAENNHSLDVDRLYIDDAKVLVNVSIERVNAFSKSGTPTVNNPANINNSSKKVIKIKNEIFSSSSWTFR